MPNFDALTWDARYEQELPRWMERPPHNLLARFADWLPLQGLALEAACGVARDGVFLAQHGLRVIGFDISMLALRAAQRRARRLALPIFLAVCDLSRFYLPPAYFDIILNFYFLERSVWPLYRQSLKPGGLLFFETFLQRDEQHPHYLQPGELRRAFADYECLYTRIIRRKADADCKPRDAEQLVVRKHG